MKQAVHRAAAAGAGAVQAWVQGDLPWAQHGGGAWSWWTLSFCGGCLHEGSVIIKLLCFSLSNPLWWKWFEINFSEGL